MENGLQVAKSSAIDQAVVEVRELTKSFETTLAVDRISFDIGAGEIVGLLGPNGAGKTTTIQMLLGVTTPTSGSIRILGLDLRRDRERILEQVNFSSTYVSMPFSLTVEENLRIFARLYHVPNAAARIDEVVRIFEIDDFRTKLTRKLSTGQMTRVSLAKALLNQPKVLFLDEPTASLDPDAADKTRTWLKSIQNSRGLSILYTSHNMREMEQMCDRILFLYQGRIIASGTPAEVIDRFHSDDLEAAFLKVARGKVEPV